MNHNTENAESSTKRTESLNTCLLRNIGVYAPVRAPRGLCGVQVEAGSHAKVKRVAFARRSDAARTRIRTHHHEAVRRCVPLHKVSGIDSIP